MTKMVINCKENLKDCSPLFSWIVCPLDVCLWSLFALKFVWQVWSQSLLKRFLFSLMFEWPSSFYQLFSLFVMYAVHFIVLFFTTSVFPPLPLNVMVLCLPWVYRQETWELKRQEDWEGDRVISVLKRRLREEGRRRRQFLLSFHLLLGGSDKPSKSSFKSPYWFMPFPCSWEGKRTTKKIRTMTNQAKREQDREEGKRTSGKEKKNESWTRREGQRTSHESNVVWTTLLFMIREDFMPFLSLLLCHWNWDNELKSSLSLPVLLGAEGDDEKRERERDKNPKE